MQNTTFVERSPQECARETSKPVCVPSSDADTHQAMLRNGSRLSAHANPFEDRGIKRAVSARGALADPGSFTLSCHRSHRAVRHSSWLLFQTRTSRHLTRAHWRHRDVCWLKYCSRVLASGALKYLAGFMHHDVHQNKATGLPYQETGSSSSGRFFSWFRGNQIRLLRGWCSVSRDEYRRCRHILLLLTVNLLFNRAVQSIFCPPDWRDFPEK